MIISNEIGTSYTVKNAENFAEISMVKTDDQTWTYESTETISFVAQDDPDNQIARSMTPELGQWDWKDGILTVISELEPVIYIGNEPCVIILDSENVTLNLTCRHTALGVKVVRSKNITVNVFGHHLGRGILVSDSSVLIPDFSISNAGQNAVSFYGDCRSSEIKGGFAADCGISESSGSVYAGNTDGQVVVQNVTVYNQHFGNYWKWDGCAFYADNGSNGIVYNDNTAVNCKRAMHDNSGHVNTFLNTKVIDCEETSLKISDVHNHNKGVPIECGTEIA